MHDLNTKGIVTVACNHCGRSEYDTLYEVDVREDQLDTFHQNSWPIVKCNHCGLIFTNPRPDNDAMMSYYNFGNSYDQQFIQDWFIQNADIQRATWQRFLNAISRFKAPGKLIDIGCGAGSFLIEAQKRGFQGVGQEISPYFVRFCREEHQLTVYEGEIEELPLDAEIFDFATAFDVIEHHPDPKKMLTEMHKLLKADGLVVISTHDIGNFYAKRYGKKWRYINPIGHFTYFSPKTLKQMMQACGFEILYTGGIHTTDGSAFKEIKNWIVQFIRVILIRGVLLMTYRPLTQRFPQLTNWKFKLGSNIISHQKLMTRLGNQIIMNDDLIMIGRKNSN